MKKLQRKYNEVTQEISELEVRTDGKDLKDKLERTVSLLFNHHQRGNLIRPIRQEMNPIG